ncbi:phenylalanine--tRNA ligase subunit beta [Bacteriovoracaceae bacterium]|nr:phenylalanine--tRNA ligase subunit beta [Bacteriovoracaceae bacterium]
MLVSLDWINDFTKTPKDISAQKIGELFTLATAEVEEVLESGSHWEKIKVAQVISKEKHPEADKLNLVTFTTDGKDRLQVVCGATNVVEGMKTPYAKVGVTLPNGLTLEPKKIRGVLSEGMLCSEEELGLSESSEGILELPSDAPLGETMLTYMKQRKDVLLDIDNKSLTHRPDLWGHYGLAREFSAIFDSQLNDKFNEDWEKSILSKISSTESPVAVKVDPKSSCLAYYGLTVKNIKVTESPDWMKRRLTAVGLRPINSIVDISNYVMLELGIPLHIFDKKKIKGNTVFINQLENEEIFNTLDEVERQLIAGDTVIRDEEKPLVLAGIMGGLNSGVDETTTEIFIEVANWEAARVRKTSTRLGLRTDSSQRYEKTLDSQLCKRTLLRTLELVTEFNKEAQVEGKISYDGHDLSDIKPLVLDVCFDRLRKILGKDISNDEISKILKNLDFKLTQKNNNLYSVEVPSYRATKDIDCDADILEEVGRIIGYDNIESEMPLLSIAPVRLNPAKELHRKIRDFMTDFAHSFEVQTYAMVGEKLLNDCSWPVLNTNLKLINSLSKDHDRMRPSLIPSFLKASALNAKNKNDFRFYEIGRAYIESEKDFSNEENHLVISYYHKDESQFMNLVNDTKTLMKALNIPGDITQKHPKFKSEVVDENWIGLHPFEYFNIRIMGKMKGALFTVHPLLLRNFKMKGQLSFAIIDLSSFENRVLKDKTKYTPLAKFPSSQFDYTVTISRDIPKGHVLECLSKIKMKEIVSHLIVDEYSQDSGDNLHLTLRTTFQDPTQTLSGEFLKISENKIIEHLDKNGFKLKA